LSDRLFQARDRLIATEKFRSWAASFAITRPIARARTRALFDLCAGFVYSQILQGCLDLDVFGKLADGPATAAALAPGLGLSEERAKRLLDAATSLRLLSLRGGGRYGLGPLGAALVGNDAIASMVAHHRMLYADLADPVALLRAPPGQTQLARYWEYDPAGERDGKQAYTALMAASQSLVAEEIIAAYPLGKHKRLLDIGGGDGSFLRAAASRHDHLQLMLFDLPAVAARAAERFEQAGLAARASTFGGSFLTDSLPPGADIISLVRVIHDHDDDAAMRILHAARAALAPDATLILAEPMADTPGAEPIGHAYFGFYLLAMGRGRPRSAARLSAMLRQAGFDRVRQAATHTPLLVSVLVARAGTLKLV
jgi:demethylspheroidene O-methyltransferase